MTTLVAVTGFSNDKVNGLSFSLSFFVSRRPYTFPRLALHYRATPGKPGKAARCEIIIKQREGVAR